jgi:hypothetical protein
MKIIKLILSMYNKTLFIYPTFDNKINIWIHIRKPTTLYLRYAPFCKNCALIDCTTNDTKNHENYQA